nr:SdpI family protein [uncultured Arsenicibacter sp.]
MKTTTRSHEWLILILMVAPFIYLGTLYNNLPERVPFHYNAEGIPDDYGPKYGLVLLFGGITAFLYFLFRYIPDIDPKQQLNSSNYRKLRIAIAACWSLLLFLLWYNTANGAQSDTFLSFLLASVGLMIASIGNFMYSVRPNYFVGIRTPWTLNSEFVWRKTHQKSAPYWVAGGLLCVMLVFLVPGAWKTAVLLTITLGLAFGSALYSFVLYRQQSTNQQ